MLLLTKRAFCLILALSAPLLLLSTNTQEIDSLQARLSVLGKGKAQVEVLVELGKKTMNTQPEQAEQYLTTAIEISEELSYPEGLGEAKLFHGYLYMKKGDREQALQLFQLALDIASQHELKKLKAETLRMLGFYWFRLGERETAACYYTESLELFQELGDKKRIARIYIQMGWLNQGWGKFDLAESYLLKGLAESEEVENAEGMINALYAVAGFYINRNTNLHLALSHLERALKLAQQEEILHQIALIQDAMGNVYTQLGKIDLAKSFFKEALERYHEIKSYSTIVGVNITLGNIAMEEKKYDEALEYFNNSLTIIDKVDNRDYELATINHAIGLVFQLRDKEHKKARAYFQKALDHVNEGESQILLSKIESSIGKSCVAVGRYEEAIEWCQKAQEHSKDLLIESIECKLCLAKAYDGLEDYKTANGHYRKWKELSDSLYQENLSVEVNNLEIQQRYKMELSKLEQAQAIEREKMKTQNAIIIGSIGFLSLLIIMLLVISNVKKTAQKNQLLVISNMRKELIANISHDLRTPLTIMQGYVETLLMRINSTSKEDRERYLNIILNSSERLAILIAQLFEFSKLEVKQIEPNKEPFKIKEVLQNSLAEYSVLASKKEVNLHIDCCENAPLVYADVSLIKRVIQNLMDNALKYTPREGSISIKVSELKDKIMVEVADTGPGISNEQQSLIFNRYQKGKDSVGAGLGLTIVKKILDLHESAINVKSELGKGTRFLFSLPVYSMA